MQHIRKNHNKLSSGLDNAQKEFCTMKINKLYPDKTCPNQVRFDTKLKVRVKVKVKGMNKVKVRVYFKVMGMVLGTWVRFPENSVNICKAEAIECFILWKVKVKVMVKVKVKV